MDARHNIGNAYSNQPIILLICGITHAESATIRQRLENFYRVPTENVKCQHKGALSIYFVRGSYTGDSVPKPHMSESHFTASTAPIFGLAKQAGWNDGPALNKFARKLISTGERQQLSAPNSLYHANFGTQTAWALNDSLGIGRLYLAQSRNYAAVSNNIAALALSRESSAEVDLDYWDAYYASGGAVADNTYIRGVSRAPGGSTVTLSNGRLEICRSHPLETMLLAARDQPPLRDAAISTSMKLIDSAKPLLSSNISVGLSGGRDSRLVTALALLSELSFSSFTAIPPELEGNIAQRLNLASHRPFPWHVKDQRKAASTNSKPTTTDLPPILERAEGWFEFTGGDNWPTYARKAPPRRGVIRLGSMALSGAFGDFTRGHYYTERDAVGGQADEAIARFERSLTAGGRVIPPQVLARGARQVKATFEEMHDSGFLGFQSLDLSFLLNRLRRQLPHPAPNTLLPLLTTSMVLRVFWDEPIQKIQATSVREMTSQIMPEWADIPYFHELAAGTNPSVTNKVTIQPTYWEVDEADFLESVEQSLAINNYFHIPMDEVRQAIAELPLGRNRTNTTFEYIFWHAAGTTLVQRINDARGLPA